MNILTISSTLAHEYLSIKGKLTKKYLSSFNDNFRITVVAKVGGDKIHNAPSPDSKDGES